SVLTAAGNYRYQVGRSISYTRKKNMVEYQKIEYAEPVIRRLVDKQGNVLVDFSKDSSTSYFFSSDASHLATWKDNTKLLLYDLKERKFIPLPNAGAALTMSFSFDSKRIAYYNSETKLIYIADLEGHVLDQIPSRHTGIVNIENIDFTGGDAFLKINNKDSICLFDLGTKKPVMNFKKSFVDEIIVSPNKKDILVSCNTEYHSSTDTKSYKGTLGVLIDAGMNIKAKLYSGSSSFFFTPGGEYIIGYGETSLMRWPVGELAKTVSFPTCLSVEELVEYNCFPFARFAPIDDAAQIEKGARKLKDLANDESDPRLRSLYYRQSRTLFDRLAYGNAKNIRKDRILFFYDWYNWIDSKLGNRNFRDQFFRIQSGIKALDDLVNSPDSVYPQLLYYAGYSHMMLANLYDSLGAYNSSFVGEILKEISFRQRVFEKDPDNKANIDFYTSAIRRLSDACDSVGLLNITNGQYADRLAMYRAEDSLLAGKIGILPDSFNLKPYYIDELTQLGASFLYVYANRPKENGNALDSAIYYADKGLALSPAKMDSAKLMIVKARAYLLRPDGLDTSRGLYRRVMDHFPNFTREAMLLQLQRLRNAGAQETGNIRSIEELLKQGH
ncbi:MAG TPA: WD40 repeat domain-containing protein, partial [Puia sp.]|nr:WD40 repeat domain-containing protein [Puia sp.]